MAGKVFISSGQGTEAERAVGRSLFDWLKELGFDPYLAIDVPTLFDLNSQILKELTSSDFFLFINFKRDTDAGGFNLPLSLFSHQEFAIAYSMGFDRIIIVNQKGAIKEGLLKFMVTNTPEFNDVAEVLGIVKKTVELTKWDKNFSRGLYAAGLRWGELNLNSGYQDHTGIYPHVTLFCDIVNDRSSHGAGDCSARLAYVTKPDKQRISSPDRSHLKVTGQQGYKQNIFPRSHGAFDVLAIDYRRPNQVFLHSALDVSPRKAILWELGLFDFDYEVFAEGFPLLRFRVRFEHTGSVSPLPKVDLMGAWAP